MNPRSRKRIALLTHDLSMEGGTGTVTAFLYRILADSGCYAPEIIALSTSVTDGASVLLHRQSTWWHGPQVLSRTWNGIPCRHVGAYLSEFEFQRYQPRSILTDMLNTYDLVQVIAGAPAWANVTKTLRIPVCLQVATLARAERRSVLATGPALVRLWRSGMTLLTSALEGPALKRMQCVFVENAWMFEFVKQRVAPNRVVFAPPGVETQVFRPQLDAGSHNGYILSVGRLADPRKNIELLLTAYARLCRPPLSPPRLVLVSTPTLREESLRLVQDLGIAGRVDILSGLSRSDLAEVYRNAGLFVLSSDEEGLGMVILEAMASGLPVVSTSCGGPETAVVEGKTGYLTPVGDAQALADAMQRVLNDPALCRGLGQAGRQRAEEHFSLAVTGKMFLNKYAELLNGRS